VASGSPLPKSRAQRGISLSRLARAGVFRPLVFLTQSSTFSKNGGGQPTARNSGPGPETARKPAKRAEERSPRRQPWENIARTRQPAKRAKEMPHSYSTLLVHVVFSTKDRARSMDATVRPDLFAYMGGIVREVGGAARVINGTEDHVHMLIGLAADMSVSECLRVVKTNSSR
jgi:hypothetical protein